MKTTEERKKERKKESTPVQQKGNTGELIGWFGGPPRKKTPADIAWERRNKARTIKAEKQLRITIDKTIRQCKIPVMIDDTIGQRQIPVTRSILSTFVQLYHLQFDDFHGLVSQQASVCLHGVRDYTKTETPDVIQDSYEKNQLFFQPRNANQIRKIAQHLCKQGLSEEDIDIAQMAITELVMKQIIKNQHVTE